MQLFQTTSETSWILDDTLAASEEAWYPEYTETERVSAARKTCNEHKSEMYWDTDDMVTCSCLQADNEERGFQMTKRHCSWYDRINSQYKLSLLWSLNVFIGAVRVSPRRSSCDSGNLQPTPSSVWRQLAVILRTIWLPTGQYCKLQMEL